MSAANKLIIEKVNKSFDEGNTEAFLSYCADDVKWNMVSDRNLTGKESIRSFMKNMNEPPQFTNNNRITDGDIVMAKGSMRMKNKEGEIQDYKYCDIYRIQNEKITGDDFFCCES